MSRRLTLAVAAVMATMAATLPSAYAGTTWATYHADNARSGVDSTEPSFNPIVAEWSNRLDSQAEYGQPVVAGDRVWVADYDAGVLYALDAATGQALRQVSPGALPHFATPAVVGAKLFLGTMAGVAVISTTP